MGEKGKQVLIGSDASKLVVEGLCERAIGQNARVACFTLARGLKGAAISQYAWRLGELGNGRSRKAPGEIAEY